MISLSLSPSGAIEAFVEPLSPQERGYFLDFPSDDPFAMQRAIYQALLRRVGRQAAPGPTDAQQVQAIAAWLAANPPTRPKAAKETLSLSDMEDFS